MTVDSNTPLGVIRAYFDSFNAGDADGMSAVFSEYGSILDGSPPHQWLGPTAAVDWYRDILIEGEHIGASGYRVEIEGEPLHLNITGDAAYVVLPTSLAATVGGQRIVQTGARYTAALRREAGTWKIASWAWAKGGVG